MSRYQDQLRSWVETTSLPDAEAERLAARLPARPRRRRPAPGALLAAALLLAVGGLTLLRPAPAPVSVARPFADQGEADLGDAVHVRWDGAGEVAGDARTMRVGWTTGRLEVEVTPDAGVGFVLSTDEAQIRVVGTGFTVVRDAFGTLVDVTHGTVGVACRADAPAGEPTERAYGAGSSVTCLPVTPASLLGRARAQLRRNDPPELVLPTLERAAVGAEGAVATEVALLRAAQIAADGRPADALVVADAALVDPDPARRVELLRLATRVALTLGGCVRAAPYAAALAAAGDPSPCPTSP